MAAAVAAAAGASATAGALAAHSVKDRSTDQPATVAEPAAQNNHVAAVGGDVDGDANGEEGSEGEDGEDGAGIVVPESALEQVPSTALLQTPAPLPPPLGCLPSGGGPSPVRPASCTLSCSSPSAFPAAQLGHEALTMGFSLTTPQACIWTRVRPEAMNEAVIRRGHSREAYVCSAVRHLIVPLALT